MARSNASCLLKEKVVLVDDEECLCLFLRENLKKDGIEAVSFREAFPVLTHLSKEWEGVVVTDVKMPGMDGLAFLSRVMAVDPQLPVILITGHGDIPMVVEAM
ncbi:MAG: response regulator, partial [Nitrospinaceae bacterium]|nr:response regulator [Nitrospinaceae bacterium]NIR55984.1 response regulator [Nitrospinaceae bacterium]NIS86427.1 response regulator [Nitrospinaceae bacterium]NIT83265.1 response regulator [Nitrospinaceae bacterium]NIU45472.1 response regulator [Nitrospinaceae bacterium]